MVLIGLQQKTLMQIPAVAGVGTVVLVSVFGSVRMRQVINLQKSVPGQPESESKTKGLYSIAHVCDFVAASVCLNLAVIAAGMGIGGTIVNRPDWAVRQLFAHFVWITISFNLAGLLVYLHWVATSSKDRRSMVPSKVKNNSKQDS